MRKMALISLISPKSLIFISQSVHKQTNIRALRIDQCGGHWPISSGCSACTDCCLEICLAGAVTYACSCDFKTVVHIPTDSVDRLTMADETAALLLFLGWDKAAHKQIWHVSHPQAHCGGECQGPWHWPWKRSYSQDSCLQTSAEVTGVGENVPVMKQESF